MDSIRMVGARVLGLFLVGRSYSARPSAAVSTIRVRLASVVVFGSLWHGPCYAIPGDLPNDTVLVRPTKIELLKSVIVVRAISLTMDFTLIIVMIRNLANRI
eukprot:3442866-Amphidinium_carterae.1